MSVPANFFDTNNIVANPAGDGETVIAILTGISPLLPGLGVNLSGWVNVQPQAATDSVELQIRRDSVAGDSVAQALVDGPGAVTGVTNVGLSVEAQDFPGDFASAVYVLTMTCASAAGSASINGVGLHARVC